MGLLNKITSKIRGSKSPASGGVGGGGGGGTPKPSGNIGIGGVDATKKFSGVTKKTIQDFSKKGTSVGIGTKPTANAPKKYGFVGGGGGGGRGAGSSSGTVSVPTSPDSATTTQTATAQKAQAQSGGVKATARDFRPELLPPIRSSDYATTTTTDAEGNTWSSGGSQTKVGFDVWGDTNKYATFKNPSNVGGSSTYSYNPETEKLAMDFRTGEVKILKQGESIKYKQEPTSFFGRAIDRVYTKEKFINEYELKILNIQFDEMVKKGTPMNTGLARQQAEQIYSEQPLDVRMFERYTGFVVGTGKGIIGIGTATTDITLGFGMQSLDSQGRGQKIFGRTEGILKEKSSAYRQFSDIPLTTGESIGGTATAIGLTMGGSIFSGGKGFYQAVKTQGIGKAFSSGASSMANTLSPIKLADKLYVAQPEKFSSIATSKSLGANNRILASYGEDAFGSTKETLQIYTRTGAKTFSVKDITSIESDFARISGGRVDFGRVSTTTTSVSNVKGISVAELTRGFPKVISSAGYTVSKSATSIYQFESGTSILAKGKSGLYSAKEIVGAYIETGGKANIFSGGKVTSKTDYSFIGKQTWRGKIQEQGIEFDLNKLTKPSSFISGVGKTVKSSFSGGAGAMQTQSVSQTTKSVSKVPKIFMPSNAVTSVSSSKLMQGTIVSTGAYAGLGTYERTSGVVASLPKSAYQSRELQPVVSSVSVTTASLELERPRVVPPITRNYGGSGEDFNFRMGSGSGSGQSSGSGQTQINPPRQIQIPKINPVPSFPSIVPPTQDGWVFEFPPLAPVKPSFDFSFGVKGFRGKQRKKYTPDFRSLILGIRGKAPKGMTGFESRPISKGFKWEFGRIKI